MTHVAALSGYVSPPDGRRLVFSILANNYNGDSGGLRVLLDRVCAELVRQ